MTDRKTAVPTAQCWLDAGLDRSLPEADRWHGLMNAYNHTENALFAERRISESYEADRLEQKADIERLRAALEYIGSYRVSEHDTIKRLGLYGTEILASVSDTERKEP